MSDLSTTGASPSLLRRLLIVLAGLFLLLVLVLFGAYFYLNLRGEREWEAFRAEWEQKGEKFEIKDFIPASVPDDQNFASTPLLAALVDFSKAPGSPVVWNNLQLKDRASAIGAPLQNPGRRKTPNAGQWQLAAPVDLVQWHQFLSADSSGTSSDAPAAARGVLSVLKQFDSELDELTAASGRPHSVFRLDYNENFRMLLPHLAPIRGISQTLRLRAVARLRAGEKQEALADVKLGLRLADALNNEPLLISQLVRIAVLQQAIQPVWEGIVRHEWSDAQLREMQKLFAGIDLCSAYVRAIRTERAFGNVAIDELRTGRTSFPSFGDPADGSGQAPAWAAGRLIPSGWFRLNQVTLNRLFQERCLPVVDAEKRRVNVDLAMTVDEAPELKQAGVFNLFARMLLPAVGKSASKFAHGQTVADLAAIACAVERYRLKHGDYPERLDPLVPEFIAHIPTDVISGELPRYRRETGGRFVLYSVGWNQSDDGGEPGVSKSGSAFDPQRGDWVWRFPSSP